MLGIVGWLGAEIYWTVSAPESVRPSALLETDGQKAQQAIVGRHLFGVYVMASAAQNAPSDIRLNGAIAAEKPGQRAYALLSIEGKPAQLVREGDELAPGITLQRVETRQVELLRGGQPLTLRLPDKAQSEANKAGTSGAALVAGAPPVPGSAPAPAPAASPAPLIETPKIPSVNPPIPQSSTPLPRRGRTRRSAEDDS